MLQSKSNGKGRGMSGRKREAIHEANGKREKAFPSGGTGADKNAPAGEGARKPRFAKVALFGFRG